MSDRAKHSGSILLADMIEYPNRNRTDHSHTEGKPKDHGLKEANKRFNVYMSAGLVRDRYPNFMEIGFRAQAFVDVILSTSGEKTTNVDDELEIRQKLNAIDNVILVYTVFGAIDIRCKVVGIDLRDVERTAMRIRAIPGVAGTTTSIIIDDTDYKSSREKWANLIKANSRHIEPGLPSKFEDVEDGYPSEESD